IAFTSNPVALRAIALGQGPRRTLFAVGYAGWGPGQLDAEMRRGNWFTAPGDEDILFDNRQGTKWKRAMDRRFRTL
ncbi:MAG: YqgE/AlgH family protein, partial [Nitrospinota bacterium]|nr:YqgE/AlgH family protein [Nitrospinota bacterium]